ncbi:hypothetical protein BOW35_01905 [Solemya velum gill symbiont]|uniref:MBL fold metallo-hydrolase n=1 Tax=Solemya velum gill symbiont TaxID=2340 RepID=UPI000995F4F1|nr:MBL fold metallo-hydrolase [Solemya velum gill symbiont]OOZ16039.1 hypothetical protein BOW27_01895 [Solemya velum gill symbiont]OOZ20195.1 hypothetical protein BOW29_02545 [Solemya velum gill symbiont]OOZ24053.1 hypothetical protein BOW30_00900 [Solemya velum gill symbiont]OOZ25685.1 hypothetical protein BOW31_00050 [Solemya velum gill symbiont]OOZ30808.1 hypothetical protein BOW33_00900 [Solemya velum gill symbiont]
MQVTFYGVRGSIASPGPDTVRYGGNTPCLRVDNGSDEIIILDAGTGIRRLGDELAGDHRPIYLLLSHQHWDHIQGFPFFKPAYRGSSEIFVVCFNCESHENLSLTQQFSDPFFPVPASALPSNIHLLDEEGIRDVNFQGTIVTTTPLNHPGGGSAYFFRSGGKSLAYMTDNELFPPNEPPTSYEEWVERCHGLDCLIHDASYTDEEIETRIGWGHSSIGQALQLGLDAGVKLIVLFHHEPDRTDDQLDEIVAECQEKVGDSMKVIAAREGETLTL